MGSGSEVDGSGSTLTPALAGVVATSLRSPRFARSGIAAILASFSTEAGAHVAAAFAVGCHRVDLLAAGGQGAGLTGPPGPVSDDLAGPLRDHACGDGAAHRPLPEPWRSFASVVIQVCALPDDEHLVLVVGLDGGGELRIAPRAVLGPVATLAAVASLTTAAQRARADLARREQEQAMISATLQHDLRSPLHTVVSGAITLRDRDGQLDEHARERLLGLLVDQSQRAADLASETLSTMAGQAPVRSMRTDVRALLESVCEAVVAQRGGDIVIAAGDALVVSDPVRLERALHNLVDNAVKYGPPGEVVHVAATIGDGHLTLTVADRGEGVSDAVLPSLFGAFVTNPDVDGGTGLGLHSTRRIAEELGGRVTYSRREGWTRFFLSVPVDEVASDDAAVDTSDRVRASSGVEEIW